MVGNFKTYLVAACVALFPMIAFANAEEQFEQDSKLAQASMNKELQQRCLADFAAKKAKHMEMKPSGEFSFNPLVSRNIYRMFYWRESDRGVAFTVPVRAKDPQRGEMAGNLACFYSVTNGGIVFEDSQQIAWKF